MKKTKKTIQSSPENDYNSSAASRKCVANVKFLMPQQAEKQLSKKP